MVEKITARVLMGLRGAGIGVPVVASAQAPAAPVMAPAVAPPPQTLQSGIGAVAEKMVGRIIDAVGVALESQVKQTVQSTLGIGAPPAAEEEPETPAKPEDALPWEVADVGSTWGDGRPMKVAVNKETKGIDLQGSLMANPFVLERAMSIAEGVGGAIKEAVTKLSTQAVAPTGVGHPQIAAPPSPPQVVAHTPEGAIDANPQTNGIASGFEAP